MRICPLVTFMLLSASAACVEEEPPTLLAELDEGKADGAGHRLMVTGEQRLTTWSIRGFVESKREDGSYVDTGELYVLDPMPENNAVWAETHTGLGAIGLQTFFRPKDGGAWVKAEAVVVSELTLTVAPDAVTVKPFSSLFPTTYRGAELERAFPGYAAMMQAHPSGVEFGFFPVPRRFILAPLQTEFHFDLNGACASNNSGRG